MASHLSYVVTGGASGVGRAIVERLARDGAVVLIDPVEGHDDPDEQITSVVGDARDPAVVARGRRACRRPGLLSGWVNNAAIFQDATLDAEPAPRILELIDANLALAVTGCHAAVNHYLSHKRAGAIVSVSSHQAQRPVRGAPPYGT